MIANHMEFKLTLNTSYLVVLILEICSMLDVR